MNSHNAISWLSHVVDVVFGLLYIQIPLRTTELRRRLLRSTKNNFVHFSRYYNNAGQTDVDSLLKMKPRPVVHGRAKTRQIERALREIRYARLPFGHVGYKELITAQAYASSLVLVAILTIATAMMMVTKMARYNG